MHNNWGSSPGGRARLSTQGGGYLRGMHINRGGSSPGGYSFGGFSPGGGVISRGLSPAFVCAGLASAGILAFFWSHRENS